MVMDAILELHHVTKNFAGYRAVDDVSFAVRPGQTIAVLGASGSGKTTTLRMIAGFLEPDQGSILIAGRDMRGVRPYERNVGLVFQDYALFPHLTVAQNIAYGLHQHRRSKADITARVDAMCQLVRLQGFEGRRPAELSGGQQQRVALARAMAVEPQLLLLDEPLSALDAKLRHELRFELKQILQDTNCTSLIVTHDQEEAMSLADLVVVMHQGRKLQEGSPAEIYGAPQSRTVAEFIGRTNWFEGQLGEPNGGVFREFLSEDGRLLIPDRSYLAGSTWHVCVRPERVIILGPDKQDDELNVVRGTLKNAALLGADIHYLIQLKSGRVALVVEQNRDQPIPESGSPVKLGFRPSDCTVVPANTTSSP
jgi:putative spermidine/putrescine transport system ATP-binding protein/putrescine transport system ATP-binding protein